ncbi:MAG: hypothetical protein M1814_006710 [Vezdaea aestivalis]|nr:MAG: hypothetical protein M1814_006710 [Vezdaea aestivalis]
MARSQLKVMDQILNQLFSSAQTHELKTLLAGTIARALAVFSVDEVIIFSDDPQYPPQSNGYVDKTAYTGYDDPCRFLTHLLSYLETPPYLRRTLFSMHPDLRTAGALPSTDMPHHLRADEWCQYREGLTHSNPHPDGQNSRNVKDTATLVDIGLNAQALINTSVPPGVRVTLKFSDSASLPARHSEPIEANAIAPWQPREEAGYYWGYGTRQADSLSAVFTESSFEGGYNFSIGTSERGEDLQKASDTLKAELADGSRERWKHVLVVFGGVAGLEAAVKADPKLAEMEVYKPESLFDAWVNAVPGQGSRTIRTEEAVWLALMGLRDLVKTNNDTV